MIKNKIIEYIKCFCLKVYSVQKRRNCLAHLRCNCYRKRFLTVNNKNITNYHILLTNLSVFNYVINKINQSRSIELAAENEDILDDWKHSLIRAGVHLIGENSDENADKKVSI